MTTTLRALLIAAVCLLPSFGQAASASLYYLYADHLNTPRVATDSTNKVVWRWDSDAFGTSTANEDPDGDGVKFTYNPRFPGQYYDKETGLHYNYHRDYEPSTGRYVQSDPIGLSGGLNTYSYVLNNPLSFTDPYGLEAIPWYGPGGAADQVGITLMRRTPVGRIASILGMLSQATGDHCCTEYKNIYDPNPKHGAAPRQGSGGDISPEPTNGQVVLDQSAAVGLDSRIGHDPTTGQIVMFRRHYTDDRNCVKYWHGYVVTQQDLTSDQWRAGRSAGYPNWPRKPR